MTRWLLAVVFAGAIFAVLYPRLREPEAVDMDGPHPRVLEGLKPPAAAYKQPTRQAPFATGTTSSSFIITMPHKICGNGSCTCYDGNKAKVC